MWSWWAWVSAIRRIGFAERLGGGQDPAVGAREHRVDEREPVLLLDEVGVDEAEAVDLVNGHSFED